MTMNKTQEETSDNPVNKKLHDTLERDIKLLELLGHLKPVNPKRIAPNLNYVAQTFEKK